jgi:hypothetical protein
MPMQRFQVEKRYLQAIGLLPDAVAVARQWIEKTNRENAAKNPDYQPIELPTSLDDDGIDLWQLVAETARGTERKPSEVWEMTLPDLAMLREKEEEEMSPAEMREHREALEKLSLFQMRELEEWVDELT